MKNPSIFRSIFQQVSQPDFWLPLEDFEQLDPSQIVYKGRMF